MNRVFAAGFSRFRSSVIFSGSESRYSWGVFFVKGLPRVSLAGAALLMSVRTSHGDIALVDATAGSGLESYTHSPNFLAVPGTSEWTMGGVGLADFDGDGWCDIFVPRGGTGFDRLYRNSGNGTFADVALAAGLASAHAGNGVACADFDRDGDIDIYLTSHGTGTNNLGQPGRHRLYRNDGGAFVDVASAAGVAFSAPSTSVADGAAWGDIDLDGDLDLAVAGWSPSAAGNRLFRNDSTTASARFVDLTGGALPMPPAWGFQPTFADLTGDGFPELLLAADFETSQAFRNERNGGFSIATGAWGMGVDANGMGSCIGDFDRNGAPDWFVTSIHMVRPAAGMRNGNALYLNGGTGASVESSVAWGCNDGGWGWGAVAFDLDSDGWEDIVEVNGRNAGEWASESEYIFRNRGAPHLQFTRLGAESGFSLAADARCVASFDYDRDGDLDLLVVTNAGPLKLYRNDSLRPGGSLVVELRASAASRCAPHGIGAVVEATAAGATQRRWVHSGSGYHSSSEPVVHFGTPGAVALDRVAVRWPSGQRTEVLGVPASGRLVIDAPRAADLDGDGLVGLGDLAMLLVEWSAADRERPDMRRADVATDGRVDARDVAAVLAAWSR